MLFYSQWLPLDVVQGGYKDIPIYHDTLDVESKIITAVHINDVPRST